MLFSTTKRLVFCAFILLMAFQLWGAPVMAQEADYVPGEVIIKFKETAMKGQREGVLRQMGAERLKDFKLIGASHHRLRGMTVEQAVAMYKDHPQVEYIEPNYILELCETPNDPLFDDQWGMHNYGQRGTAGADMRATHAWDVFTGSDQIVVGLIDTGVDYNHPDLAANIWTNPGEIPFNGVDDDSNGYVDDIHGWDFVGDDNDPMDSQDNADVGHGTHCAGVIGAIGHDGTGVAGVNWNVKIMAIKIFGEVSTSAAAIHGVSYATLMGAHLTSNSWTEEHYSEALYAAVQAAGEAGILFVAAAGNNTEDLEASPFYPAGFDLDNVVSVAATDYLDQLAYYSNYGATSVDLGAPGSYIVSTSPNNQYEYRSGTSMATPHVAGVLALMMGKYGPDSGIDFKDRLLATVDPLASLQGKCVTGGRLNAFLAVAEDDFTPPATVQAASITEIASNWVGLEWMAGGDDGMSGTASAYDIRYSTSPIQTMADFEAAIRFAAPPDPIEAGLIQGFTLEGLEQGTTYYMAVRVLDEWGSYYLRLGGDLSANASDLVTIGPFTTLGPPAITLDPTSLVVTAEKWASNTATFEVQNPGVGTLDYEIPVPLAYPWVECVPASGTLRSGENETVTVFFTADHLPCGANPASLDIASNDPLNPLTTLPLDVTVTGGPEIEVEPMYAIDFGPVIHGESKSLPIEVSNLGCDLLNITEFSIDEPEFVLSRKLRRVPGETTETRDITFTPLAYGTFNATLTIASLDPDEPVIEISLSGRGVTPPAIVVHPTEIAPDAIVTGDTHVEPLMIVNTGECLLEFSLSPGTTDWLTISLESGTVAPGEWTTVDVTLDALGHCSDQTGVLAITSNDPDNEAIDIPVTMAVTPASDIQSLGLDFGEQFPLEDPIVESLEIRNEGCDGHPLTISNVELSPTTVFSIKAPTPVTIDPGEAWSFAVTLHESMEIGANVAIVTVTSDDPDDTTYEINVSATGVIPNGPVEAKPTVALDLEPLPLNLRAAPNPFRAGTTVYFNLADAGEVGLRIYDVRGALVRALDGGFKQAGAATLAWDGRSRSGEIVATGVYFYRLLHDGRQLGDTKKMVMLR